MKWRPGVKVIEKGEGYRIVRFSWWVPSSTIDAALERIRKDAAVSGRKLTITRGDRLVRVEGDVCAS